MTFATKDSDEGVVLSISGDLDAISVPELRTTIDRLTSEPHPHVIIDLAGLHLIDSSGVGAIVSLYKRVRARGGAVTIRGLCDQPLAIFKLLKLDRVLVPMEMAPPAA